MKFQPGQSGNTKGRPKGSPNKITASVKEAIMAAFDNAGGVEYLEGIAKSDPRTFCALLGKILPTTIAGDEDGPLRAITKIEIVAGKCNGKH